MKFFEYIKDENIRTTKICGLTVMKQTSDYMTTERHQEFLGGLVSTTKTSSNGFDSSKKEIKIYILSVKCLKDLQVIINNSRRENVEKYTTIKLIAEGQTVELPREHCITDIEINRIKNTFGIDKVEVM